MDQSEADEIGDYQTLIEATKKKMTILADDSSDVDDSMKDGFVGSVQSRTAENADEFLRNFFIKFGMKKTLDSFQTEWYELKARGELMAQAMPQIPGIYRRNQELSDELAVL